MKKTFTLKSVLVIALLAFIVPVVAQVVTSHTNDIGKIIEAGISPVLLKNIALMSIPTLIAMVVFGMFLKKDKENKKTNENSFKKNISLLRDEKIIVAAPHKSKKRRKLLRQTKNYSNMSDNDVLEKSKRIQMPAGEILLANKINMSRK